jgi:MFS transporter, DHA1 family, multidrug resistance protein
MLPKARPTGMAVIVLLTCLTGIIPLSIDMPLAGLPSLAADFGETEARAQLVIAVFLSGFALAQLILGPISDRYGRRPVLLTGLTAYAVAGVACLLATDLETLLQARFVQGIAACAGPVAARAVVADIYEGSGAQRAMSIVTAGMGVAPIMAPMLGGLLLLWFDWHAIFVTLAASGAALLLAVILMLQETNPPHHRRELRPIRVLLNYLEMLRSRTFLAFSLPSMLGSAALFSFISAAPFVIIRELGYAPQAFGVFFAIVMVGFITGASLSARLSRTRSPEAMMRLGSGIMAAGAILMIGGAIGGLHHIAALVVPMAVIMHGMGLMRPNSIAGAMAPFRDRAGAASALLGFLQMGGGVLAGLVAATRPEGGITLLATSIAIAAFGILPLLAFELIRPRQAQQAA